MTAAAYVEDVLLVDRCLTGEPAATRELFRRHQKRVHASLYRVLGTNRDMDDLLQEAFLQVFQSLKGWRAEASLSTWVDRVSVRVAYRYLAQKKRRIQTDAMADDDAAGPDLSTVDLIIAEVLVRDRPVLVADQAVGMNTLRVPLDLDLHVLGHVHQRGE